MCGSASLTKESVAEPMTRFALTKSKTKRGNHMRRVVLCLAVLGAAVLLVPATSSAQAAITGVVRDTSGAVMPGVIVEASSPALIEKTRTVVTDSSGQYRIVDLPPGHLRGGLHAGRVQDGAPRRHRAPGHVHRAGERRAAGRRARGNASPSPAHRRPSTSSTTPRSSSPIATCSMRFRRRSATRRRARCCCPGTTVTPFVLGQYNMTRARLVDRRHA